MNFICLKFLFVESKTDSALLILHKAAKKAGFESYHHFYEKLELDNEMCPVVEGDEDTVAFLAFPFQVNRFENSNLALAQMILDKYKFKYVINHKLFDQGFQKVEDKIYQTHFFIKNNFPIAKVINQKDLIFPIIARKRLSSVSLNNFVLRSKEDYLEFDHTHEVDRYVLQEYYPLMGDYRVLVVGGKVVEVIQRDIKFKKENRVVVKVKAKSTLPKSVCEECERLAKTLGSDYVGVDIGERENHDYIFIEYNNRAQIKKTVDLYPDVASRIFERILELVKN